MIKYLSLQRKQLITAQRYKKYLKYQIFNSKNIQIMAQVEFRSVSREVMTLAWQFIKRNGMNLSEALKAAWANIKLRTAMKSRIVKFYFQKVDGTIREAYGTLKENIVPAISGNDHRKKNDTVQTFFDTEKSEWRCFKKANLIEVVAL